MNFNDFEVPDEHGFASFEQNQSKDMSKGHVINRK